MWNRTKIKYRGIEYRSKFEVEIAKQLYKKKVKFKFENERISYTVPARNATYLPDFKIIRADGTHLFLEVKGRLTRADRKKYALVKAHTPGLDLRFLFGFDNKVEKNSKYRYSDWCETNGFKWCVKDIPEEWLKE